VGNELWAARWAERLNQLVADCLPSGSGFDSHIELITVTDQKMVFSVPYHPMDGHGCYDAWVTARVVVRATFGGLDVTARGAGASHNDYIAECLHAFLSEDAPAPDWHSVAA
jgi:hypothetical protein